MNSLKVRRFQDIENVAQFGSVQPGSIVQPIFPEHGTEHWRIVSRYIATCLGPEGHTGSTTEIPLPARIIQWGGINA